MTRLLLVFIISTVISACGTMPPTADGFARSAVGAPVQVEAKPRYATGSIFTNGTDLYPTTRTYQAGELFVGDLITVVLTETTNSTRSAGVTASRNSTNDVLGTSQAGAILPSSSFFDNFKIGGANITHAGTGTSGQAATLTGQIGTVVTDVLPNGNLMIAGQKQLSFTEGTEFIQISGIIRPEDVQPNNTILSTRIAQAEISYSGTGALSDAAKPGWMTRALFSVWPF